jgi:hypothetical protein
MKLGAMGMVVVALAFTELVGGCRPNTNARTSQKTPNAVPSESKASSVPSAGDRQASYPQIKLDASGVYLDGVNLASPTSAPERMSALVDEVANRVERESGKKAVGIDEPFYELGVTEGSNLATLKSAFQSVAFSGWRRALLVTKSGELILSGLVPLRPDHPEAKLSNATRAPVFLAIHADKTEFWLGREVTSTEPPTLSSTWVTSNVNSDGLSELRRHCANSERCKKIAFQVADDVSIEALLRTFESIALLCTENGARRCELGFRIRPPEPLGKPPTFLTGSARVGETRVSGRLPPEVIQATVRAAVGQMRKCYKSGLAQDPTLRGRVVVRFVIGRDGKVGSVTLVTKETSGRESVTKLVTDMVDSKVSECVLDVCRNLEFPEPDGGIVTVVYPMLFQPDDAS